VNHAKKKQPESQGLELFEASGEQSCTVITHVFHTNRWNLPPLLHGTWRPEWKLCSVLQAGKLTQKPHSQAQCSAQT